MSHDTGQPIHINASSFFNFQTEISSNNQSNTKSKEYTDHGKRQRKKFSIPSEFQRPHGSHAPVDQLNFYMEDVGKEQMHLNFT